MSEETPGLTPFKSAMLPNYNADIVSVRRVVDPNDEEDGVLELLVDPIPVYVKRLKVRTWMAVSGVQQSLDDAQILVAVMGLAVDDVIDLSHRVPEAALATSERHRVTSVLPPQAGALGVSACRVTTVQRSR